MHFFFPRSYFALQLAFAQRIAARFALPLTDALLHYTTFAVMLHAEADWDTFARLLTNAPDPLELTYQWYLERRDHEREPQPEDTTFNDRPLFGCFYFDVRDATIIRPHFLNNDIPGMRSLSRERFAVRREELRRMFTHIRQTVPEAATVHGNSWLYNLPAYIRLFPPNYTLEMEENTDGVLQQLVLWFQCYDRFWEIKPGIAATLLQCVDQVNDLADLRFCFPYQRLRPRAPIADFYAFYNISE